MSNGRKRSAVDLSQESMEQLRAIVRTENKELVGGMIPKRSMNHFHTVERMLEIYKPMCHILADAEAYMDVEYHERAKDIIQYSERGGAAAPITADDRARDIMRARAIEYQRSRDNVESIKRIMRPFEGKKEFVVLRMYYMGENSKGRERPINAPRYTWEEIADEIGCSVRTVRRWKNNLINRMAACIGGMDALFAESEHWASMLDKRENVSESVSDSGA